MFHGTCEVDVEKKIEENNNGYH